MRRAGGALLATLLGTGTAARDAHALGSFDLEVGAELGMGTSPTGYAPNPFGLGLGARGGVSVMGFYGGLKVMEYFGSSVNEGGFGNLAWDYIPGPHSFSQRSLLSGVEAGYGIKLFGRLRLRAQLGVGNATTTGSLTGQLAPGTPRDWSNSTLYLEPGLTAIMSIGTWFVGADVNALVLTAFEYQGFTSTETGLTGHGQVGVTF